MDRAGSTIPQSDAGLCEMADARCWVHVAVLAAGDGINPALSTEPIKLRRTGHGSDPPLLLYQFLTTS